MKRKKSLITAASRSRKSKRLNNNSDRITDLPKHLKHHILSFLPDKDDTKTCCLSKTWYSVWTSFPVLIFDQPCFEEAMLKEHTRTSYNKSVKAFCDYIERSINCFPSDTNIQKFKLVIYNEGLPYGVLSKWLMFDVSKDVQDLVLHKLSNSRRMCYFKLDVLCSVKELDLLNCWLRTDKLLGASFQLPVRKLYLDSVHTCSADSAIEYLLESCHVLEVFSMRNCWGFRNVVLPSLKLERVDLELARDKIVSIESPNLQFLSYDAYGAGTNLMNNFNCKNLKELTIKDMGFI